MGSRMTRRRRVQAGVIGGIIILAILFSVAVPLIMRYQKGSTQVVEKTAEKVSRTYEMLGEMLRLAGVPVTTENLLADKVPGVIINNTGTVPATLQRIWLLYKDGSIYSIIDLVNYTQSGLVKRVILNPDTASETLLPPGKLPQLQPGDSLLIVFSIPFDEAEDLVVRAETTRGIMHPRSGGEGVTELMPTTGTGGGGGGGTGGGGSSWRGVYMPLSGFIVQGYDQIVKSCIISQYTPPIYAYTGDYWGDSSYIYYSRWWYYDDPDYPGLYQLGIETSSSGYIYYRDSRGYWDYIRIHSGDTIEFRGFLGTFSSDTVNGEGAVFLEGWAFKILLNGREVYSEDKPRYMSGTYYTDNDMDGNGVDELYVPTAWWNADEFGDRDDDVLVTKIEIARDITGVDAIEVYVKLNYDIHFYGAGRRIAEKFRTAVIAIERLDVETGIWRIVGFKDYPYLDFGPRQIVFGNVFPVDRDGIYRVVVFIYDPFSDVPLDSLNSGDYGQIEFYQSLEHIIVQMSVNNPYLPVAPPTYILAIPGVNFTYLGGSASQVQQDLLERVEYFLRAMGVSSYVVIDSMDKYKDIIFGNPPRNAIIINLHGGTIPLPEASTTKLEELGDIVRDNNMLWVQVLVGPPEDPTNPSSDAQWFLSDGTTTLGISAEYALQIFTGIYTLDLTYLQDEAGQPGVPSNITEAGRTVRAQYLALELPDELEATWSIQGIAPLTNQTYYHYTQEATDYPTIATYPMTGESAILINGLGPINWATPGEGETDPQTAAATTVYLSLYSWSKIHLGG